MEFGRIGKDRSCS